MEMMRGMGRRKYVFDHMLKCINVTLFHVRPIEILVPACVYDMGGDKHTAAVSFITVAGDVAKIPNVHSNGLAN
jgi:hypothetical protein